MRLDKYLKVSRIIKRRTLAKELVDLGRVEINGRVAKPSTEVNVNDLLSIRLRDRRLNIKVKEIKEFIKAEEADSLFEIVSEEYFKN